MAFTDIDLMNVMKSEINRYIDSDFQIKRAPSLTEIDGDYQNLLESLMDK